MHETGNDLARHNILQVSDPLVDQKACVKQKQCQEEMDEDMDGIACLCPSVNRMGLVTSMDYIQKCKRLPALMLYVLSTVA